MQITELKPNGYCGGVTTALKKTIAAINKYQGQNIYLLGMLIHNETVCEALKAKGVIILEGNSRLKMLDEITNGIVIISAHGVCQKVYAKIKEKGLTLIDATCPNVLIIHQKIKEHLEKGYHVLYIGSKNHPEAIGVCDEDERIKLITSLNDLACLDKEKNYYITNQTTLALSELSVYHDYIKKNFKKALIENKICLATTKRQEALYNLTGDLLIVIGGKESSNTEKLVKAAAEKAHFQKIIKILDVTDLTHYDLTNCDNIYITSGASTPHIIIENVIKYLKKEPYETSYPLELLLR